MFGTGGGAGASHLAERHALLREGIGQLVAPGCLHPLHAQPEQLCEEGESPTAVVRPKGERQRDDYPDVREEHEWAGGEIRSVGLGFEDLLRPVFW